MVTTMDQAIGLEGMGMVLKIKKKCVNDLIKDYVLQVGHVSMTIGVWSVESSGMVHTFAGTG